MSKKMKKVEKYITEVQGETGVKYRVNISILGKAHNKTFKTIEEARSYISELKTHTVKGSNYPYNLIEELRLTSPNLDINYIEEHFEENLDFVLTTLTEREAFFIDEYYRKDYTYSAIALQHNLSNTRIQQIIAKAIRKLRHPARSCYLIYGKEYKELQSDVKKEIKALEEKLITLRKLNVTLDEEIQKKLDEQNVEVAVMKLTISDLDLSVRAQNCLTRAGIKTIADLISKTEDEMLRVRNLGRKSFREIKEKLNEMDLDFYKE